MSLTHKSHSSIQHVLNLLNVIRLHQLLSNDGFQQCTLFPCSRSYRVGHCPTTHSMLQLALRLVAISHQPSAILSALSRLNSTTNRPVYNISARTAQKISLLFDISSCCNIDVLIYEAVTQ